MVDHKKSIQNKSKIVQSKVSKDLSTAYKKYANGFNRPSLLLNLEARMMFDGAAPIAADEIIENTTPQSPESLPEPIAADTTTEATAESSEAQLEESTSADDVDGIADSLEVGEDSSAEIVSAEEASDALALDGADSVAAPLFGPEATATPVATTVSTSTDSVDSATVEAESSSEPEQAIEEEYETVAEAVTEADEAEEAVVEEEPEVNRVVFIDTSVAGFEELLDGVIAEVEAGSEEVASELITDTVSLTESSDADAANLSTAPPAADDVVSNSTQVASSDLGATSSLEDAGYIANEDGAIIVDGVAIYLLDPNDNQIEEITETLAGYTDLDAIDIISHGAAGEIQLGNQRVNNETLSDYADLIAQWGDALAENGDILLHGCEVADSTEFLDTFAELTDADVAASDDDTGNAEFGGDFELEVSTGSIEAVALLAADTAAAFEGVLAAGDHDTDGECPRRRGWTNSSLGSRACQH